MGAGGRVIILRRFCFGCSELSLLFSIFSFFLSLFLSFAL